MKLSVIIPLANAYDGRAMKEREEALLFSLRTFYLLHDDIEIIFACQDYSLPEYIYYSAVDFKQTGKIKAFSLSYPVFNKGWCINCAAKIATGDYLCVVESDMWAEKPYLTDVVDWMKSNQYKWCFGWDKLLYTDESERKQILSGNKIQAIDRESDIVEPKSGGSEGGIVFYKKDFFLSIGGCCEFFEMLGGPDNEIARRCAFASKTYVKYNQFVYHLWHERLRRAEDQTRLNNREIYKLMMWDLGKANRVLAQEDFGNIERPLCAVKKFRDIF